MITYEVAKELNKRGFSFQVSFATWIEDDGSTMLVSREEYEGVNGCLDYDAPDATQLMKVLPRGVNAHDRHYELLISIFDTMIDGKKFHHIYARYELSMGYHATPAVLCGFPSEDSLEDQLAWLLIELKEKGYI